jgi:predicted TIM-barrel fold metal-dependent hydrolase
MTATQVDVPPIISVDDHIMEPPTLWTDRLPAKFRAAAPRVKQAKVERIIYHGGQNFEMVESEDGKPGDYWIYEDKVIPMKRINASAGMPLDLRENVPITYAEMRPSCYDVNARLADMDAGHMEASLCFPTFPRFCGQTFAEGSDKDLGLACVQAYNDFMVEEWCGTSGGRLIPLCLIPLWDVELAVAEIHRNAARGVRAVAFSEIPYHLGLPSIHSGYWDPFFNACAETGTSVNMHIGSSSKMPYTSPDAPNAVSLGLSFNNSVVALVDFLMSGILPRYPDLRLAFSEGQIGWMPYVIERIDDVWIQHRAWAGVQDLVPEPPSTYFHKQVYGCFFRDRHGARSLDVIGEDNVLFEVDFPHTDSTWPDTKKLAEHDFAGLSAETIYKIVRGNAIKLYQLDLDKDLCAAPLK